MMRAGYAATLIALALMAIVVGRAFAQDGGTTTPSSADTTPPIIYLYGANPVYLTVGGNYVEYGAAAYDAVDGNVTNRLGTNVVSLNVNVAGDYSIEYTASDLSGNYATAVRTVHVIDAAPPVITLIGPNPLYVPQWSVYEDPGATAEDSVSGVLTASIVASSSVDTARAGAHSVHYSVADASGNIASTTRNVYVTFVNSTNPNPATTTVGTAPPGSTGSESQAIDASGVQVGTVPSEEQPAENTPPTITLIGPTTFSIPQGAPLPSNPVSATDAEDGDLSHAVTLESSVNTAVPGMYTITYSVTDSGGLQSVAEQTVYILAPTTQSDTTTSGIANASLKVILPGGAESKEHEAVGGLVRIEVKTEGASGVELRAVSLSDQAITFIGAANPLAGDTTLFTRTWDTRRHANGRYRVFARITRDGTMLIGGRKDVLIENAKSAATPFGGAHINASSTTALPNAPDAAVRDLRERVFESTIDEERIRQDIQDTVTGKRLEAASSERDERREGAERASITAAGCKNSIECKTFCEAVGAGIREECASFVRADRMPERMRSVIEAVPERKIIEALDERNGPNGCTTTEMCRAVCSDPVNDHLCKAFVREEKLLNADELAVREDEVERSREAVSELFSERTGARAHVDSDGDGVTDFDEVNLYRTDPERTDSDGDGAGDGAELVDGKDPLGDVDEAIPYESPRDAGPSATDVVSVGIRSRESAADDAALEPSRLTIRGMGPPNSIVTLYIYSEPIVVRVLVDENGLFTYTLDRELPDGEHEVYAAITDARGAVLAKSSPVPFVSTAGAAGLATILTTPAKVEEPFFGGTTTILVGLITLGTLFVALGLLGFIRGRTKGGPQRQ